MLKRPPKISTTTIYVLAAGLLIVAALNLPRDQALVAVHEVKDPAAASLAMINEIAKLIMTLNAAMLAAAGGLALKAPQWIRLSRADRLLIVLVFPAGAASYFGVYFSQVRILSMVDVGVLDPLELGILWGIRLQYGGIITGVFLLGLVFARIMERGPAGPADKEPD